MMQVLMVLWVANRKVYGAHKLWKTARRAGHEIGRDQVSAPRALDIFPDLPHARVERIDVDEQAYAECS